jgi:hypothetical protein
MPENPWHNVIDKFDAFVPTHFFGNIWKQISFLYQWIANLS